MFFFFSVLHANSRQTTVEPDLKQKRVKVYQELEKISLSRHTTNLRNVMAKRLNAWEEDISSTWFYPSFFSRKLNNVPLSQASREGTFEMILNLMWNLSLFLASLVVYDPFETLQASWDPTPYHPRLHPSFQSRMKMRKMCLKHPIITLLSWQCQQFLEEKPSYPAQFVLFSHP